MLPASFHLLTAPSQAIKQISILYKNDFFVVRGWKKYHKICPQLTNIHTVRAIVTQNKPNKLKFNQTQRLDDVMFTD